MVVVATLCSCSKKASTDSSGVSNESSTSVVQATEAIPVVDYENFTFTFDKVEYKMAQTLQQMLDKGWVIDSLDPSEVPKRTITPGKYIDVALYYSKNKDIKMSTSVSNATKSNILAANGELIKISWSFYDMKDTTQREAYGKENLAFKGGLTIGDKLEKVKKLFGTDMFSCDFYSCYTGTRPRYVKEIGAYKYTIGFDIDETKGLVGFQYAKLPVVVKK